MFVLYRYCLFGNFNQTSFKMTFFITNWQKKKQKLWARIIRKYSYYNLVNMVVVIITNVEKISWEKEYRYRKCQHLRTWISVTKWLLPI